jgi:hypothetical protein
MELAGCLQPAWMPRTATLSPSSASVQTGKYNGLFRTFKNRGS